MSTRNKKTTSKNFKWIIERETALSILMLLAKLGKASRYDLASQLKFSYATVMNYIGKFKKAGIVREIGDVEAERGGKKTLYEPTQKALDLMSEVALSMTSKMGMKQPTVLPSSGFYSLGASPHKKKLEEKKKVEDVLNDMNVDVAVVVNYQGYAIPIMQLSSLGTIEQASATFSENVSQRILAVANLIAKRIAEAKKS